MKFKPIFIFLIGSLLLGATMLFVDYMVKPYLELTVAAPIKRWMGGKPD